MMFAFFIIAAIVGLLMLSAESTAWAGLKLLVVGLFGAVCVSGVAAVLEWIFGFAVPVLLLLFAIVVSLERKAIR